MPKAMYQAQRRLGASDDATSRCRVICRRSVVDRAVGARRSVDDRVEVAGIAVIVHAELRVRVA